MSQWEDQEPRGRFLEKDDATGYWYCISEKLARRKTSQLLREGAAKIRRELKTESDMKKKRAQTPLPALVTMPPQETENIAQLTPYNKKSLAVASAAARTPTSTARKLNSPIPFKNTTRNGSTGGNSKHQSNTSTPLKQITPAEANTRVPTPLSAPHPYYRYNPQPHHHHCWHQFSPTPYYSPVSVAAANRPVFTFGGGAPRPPPPPHLPITAQTPTNHTRKEESSAPYYDVNQVTPDDGDLNNNKSSSSNCHGTSSSLTLSPNASSSCHESPLEVELSTFQASWDFDGDILDNCEDISSLVEDIERNEDVAVIKMVDESPAAEEGSSIHPGVTSSLVEFKIFDSTQKTLFRPSPPRGDRLLGRQLSPPQLSPSVTQTTDPSTGTKKDEDYHLFDTTTWGACSFNSVDSLEEEDSSSPCQDSFDMDGIVSPESRRSSSSDDGGEDGDSGLPSAVDILNELDKELEEEFLRPLSAF